VRRDRNARIFTDPTKIHRVEHEGPYYRVDRIHLAEPSPQRTLLLYQAGTSRRGRAFAARHAEAIFLTGQTKPILARAVRDIWDAAKAFGRDPYDIRLFAGATVIVARRAAVAVCTCRTRGITSSAKRRISASNGWNCSMNNSMPAAWKARTRSATSS
jgi:long-chain alkane monooxygenase